VLLNEPSLLLDWVRSTKSKNTKYQDKIKKAEQQAKERKQNIWSIENYAQADKVPWLVALLF
jgi:micrococcal nuclease